MTYPTHDPADPAALPVFHGGSGPDRLAGLAGAATITRDPATPADSTATAPAPQAGPAPAAVTSGRTDATYSTERPQFWHHVTALQNRATRQIQDQTSSSGRLVSPEREQWRAVIEAIVADEARTRIRHNTPNWPADYELAVKRAALDGLAGLGRFQPYVEDPTVEELQIYGHDNGHLNHTDGTTTQIPPVAESDDDLVGYLRNLAHQHGRSFSPSNPELNLALPGKVRLNAVFWNSPKPLVTIRRQTLTHVDLEDLRQYGALDQTLLEFLSAAVRARRNIAVSGEGQGSGKTTMLRALAYAIPESEPLVTLESEEELYLYERRPRVSPLHSSYGSGESVDPRTGRPKGEFTIEDLAPTTLRRGTGARVIVGEIRHPAEVGAAVRAMQVGSGSMFTVHADSAQVALRRVTSLVGAYFGGDYDYAADEVGALLSLIVYLGVDVDPNTGRRYRYISEVAEVQPVEGRQRIRAVSIFKPGPDGRAIPDQRPLSLDRLEAAGFNPALLDNAAGLWHSNPTRRTT